MGLSSVAGKSGIMGDLAHVAIQEIDRDVVARHAVGSADAACQPDGCSATFGLTAAERVHLEQDSLAGALCPHLAGMGVVAGGDWQEIECNGVCADAEGRHQTV